jgi:hypothetical protein
MRLTWMSAESPAGYKALQVAKSAENGIALALNLFSQTCRSLETNCNFCFGAVPPPRL